MIAVAQPCRNLEFFGLKFFVASQSLSETFMSRAGLSVKLLRVILIACVCCLFASSATSAFAADPPATEDEGSVLDMFKEPPLTWKTDSAIFTAAVFLILLLILWRFAWGPIRDGLDKREQGIADHISAAERQNEQAKNILSQYEAKLAEAAGEVRELLEEARRDAEHTKEEIVAAARKEAEAEKNRALHEINTAKDQALKDLAERSADMAVDLAGKIVHTKMTKDDHAALIREAIGGFVQSKPANN